MDDCPSELARLRTRCRRLRNAYLDTRLQLARAEVAQDVIRNDLTKELAAVLQKNQDFYSELVGFRHSRWIKARDFFRRWLTWLPGGKFLFGRWFRPAPTLPLPESTHAKVRDENPDQADHKRAATALARVALDGLFSTPGMLTFPPADSPKVSIVLVLYNRAELTLGCLQSILATTRCPYEIIVVDNASTDDTAALLERLRGVRIIRNESNRGFPAAVNQAAAAARGEHLLLLNNDTQLLGPAIDTAAEFLDSHGDVGAVGGKIVLLNGTLQEAGCILFQEGYTNYHGRGGQPREPSFQVWRDVDYCSGACLMVRRELFDRVGRFEEAYSPGYYEDVELCVRLWQAGQRVVYHPHIALLHYENASFSHKKAHDWVLRNQQLFLEKNRRWLIHQPSARKGPTPLASFTQDDRPRVVLVTDGYSTPGALRDCLQELLRVPCFVTLLLLPGADVNAVWPQAIDGEVELADPADRQALSSWFRERTGFYQMIIVLSGRACVEEALDPVWRRLTPIVDVVEEMERRQISQVAHLMRSLQELIRAASGVKAAG